MLRIDRSSDRPDSARPPLDPDHDPLLGSEVVDPGDDPLCEPAGLLPPHQPKDTIALAWR